MAPQKADTVAAVCRALLENNLHEAEATLDAEYPFAPTLVTKRRFRRLDYTRQFIRDGFIDRYSGQRLVFPPALRLISAALPTKFPFHPNWKTDVTHPAYWELIATIDHYLPVTRGGVDAPPNWMTTSQARNSAKLNWTVDELGWKLHDAGDVAAWDGMLHWCLDYSTRHPEHVPDEGVRQWLRAGSEALRPGGGK